MSPRDQFVLLGDNAIFTVEASGFGIMYQWLFEGLELDDVISSLTGANSASLTIVNVNLLDLGLYSCVVSNVVTSVTSDSATLGLCEHWYLLHEPPFTKVTPLLVAISFMLFRLVNCSN